MAAIDILEGARREIGEVFNYYKNIRSGLGITFTICLGNCIDRIERFPEMYALARKQFRLAQVSKFPYVLVYALETSDRVAIHALVHAARDLKPIWKYLN